MALRDAEPTESPIGVAVASGAVLAALMEALIEQGVLTPTRVLNVILTAQGEVGRVQNSPAHESAKVVLKTLTKRFAVA